MRSEPWSDERIDLLKRMWEAGATAPAIAAELGGVSRSAVLGKVFRLRLRPNDAGGPPAIQAAAPAATERVARRRAGVVPAKSPNAKTERKGKSLFELTNDCCRWPYRRPGTEKYFFCGVAEADLEAGVPYCARHMKRAYLVPPPHVIKSRLAFSSPVRAKAASAA
jgi:GcrA cell cycle regulator